jgi:hypothetical protein
MNVGIVLDPSYADFNGGANDVGTFYGVAFTAPGSGSIQPMTSSWSALSSSKTAATR